MTMKIVIVGAGQVGAGQVGVAQSGAGRYRREDLVTGH